MRAVLSRAASIDPSPVLQTQDLVCPFCNGTIVCGHEDAGSVVGSKAPKQVGDLERQIVIQVRGRLVCNDERGFSGKRSGNRDPLSLSGRESCRQPVGPIGEVNEVERRHSPPMCIRLSQTQQGESEGDVLVDGQDRQEIQICEDKAHVPCTEGSLL